MRIIRLYYPQEIKISALIVLSPDVSARLRHVLKYKEGDQVNVFNSFSGEFTGLLETVAPSACRLRIVAKLKDSESCFGPCVAVPLIKEERFKFVIEALVQMGVSEIAPIRFDRSQKGVCTRKLSNYVVGALEQSGRCAMPTLATTTTLYEFISKKKLVIYGDLASEKKLGDFTSLLQYAAGEIGILVGPEGGFSHEEFANLVKCDQAIGVKLSDFVLRSETALLYLIAHIKFLQNYSHAS